MSKKTTSNGWSKDSIQALIDTNDRAVMRALLVLYSRQTEAEQATESTREHNGRGFSAFDAEILSSFAVQVKSRGTLTPRQLEVARKRVRSYWKQLLEVASQSSVQYRAQSV
jgi:hypothetical protein